MIDIIRGFIKTFVQGVYSTFTADGRSDETITGSTYQHYGFWSYPPTGTEIISLQFGQNNVSVAENAGNIFDPKSTPQEGDTYLYSKSGTRITLPGDSNSISLTTKPYGSGDTYAYSISLDADDKLIDISTPTQHIIIDEDSGLVKIDDNFQVLKTPLIPGTLAPLATQDLVTAIQTFMVSCAAATDPHASEIKAAAVAFNSHVPSTFVTQATKAV